MSGGYTERGEHGQEEEYTKRNIPRGGCTKRRNKLSAEKHGTHWQEAGQSTRRPPNTGGTRTTVQEAEWKHDQHLLIDAGRPPPVSENTKNQRPRSFPRRRLDDKPSRPGHGHKIDKTSEHISKRRKRPVWLDSTRRLKRAKQATAVLTTVVMRESNSL